MVVIEWKTSQRTKSTLEDAYDDPVQIAAYVGALNADDKYPFVVNIMSRSARYYKYFQFPDPLIRLSTFIAG